MLKTLAGDIDGAVDKERQNYSEKKVSKMTKSKSTKSSSGSGFLTFKVRIVFTQLRQAFTEASIFQHFDPKYHI